MTKMKSVLETVIRYKEMEDLDSWGSMLREVRMQYADMDNGGDGGSLGYTPSDYSGPTHDGAGPSCREYNYPNYPDNFFQEVCALIGWKW